MKKFVFIVARTPRKFQNPLRNILWKHCKKSLQVQKCNDWQAIVVGDEEKTDGNILYINDSAVLKRDKILAAIKYISSQEKKPEFLIRFDDDDLISPIALLNIVDKKFDCYTDSFHSYYDIITGRTSQVDWSWFPNTCIHSFKCATEKFGEANEPLISLEHSLTWHKYYQSLEKKVMYFPKQSPFYLRIMSPSSITSTNNKEDSKDNKNYFDYLLKYGVWKKKAIPDFKELCNEIQCAVKGNINFNPLKSTFLYFLALNKLRSIKNNFKFF
jgi:hypothetical protein